MSIAVGVRHKGLVALATDSIIGESSSQTAAVGPPEGKLWCDTPDLSRSPRITKRAIAHTGKVAIGQQLTDFLAQEGAGGSAARPLYFESARGLRSIFVSFDGWLRERCPWLGDANDGYPLWSNASFIVAGPTGLWCVGADLSVVEVRDVVAVGIGREAAQAVVRTLAAIDKQANAPKLAEAAVRHVLAHYSGVLGPVRSAVVILR